MVDTTLGSPHKLAPGVRQIDVRGRRWFSDWYRRDVIRRCLEPGASVAAIAMQAGLNANLVRKWIARAKEHEAPNPVTETVRWLPVSQAHDVEPPTVSPTPSDTSSSSIEIKVGAATIVIGPDVSDERLMTVIRALR
jgi:transposase